MYCEGFGIFLNGKRVYIWISKYETTNGNRRRSRRLMFSIVSTGACINRGVRTKEQRKRECLRREQKEGACEIEGLEQSLRQRNEQPI